MVKDYKAVLSSVCAKHPASFSNTPFLCETPRFYAQQKTPFLCETNLSPCGRFRIFVD